MSFFYTKSAPEYKEYKLKEGEFDEAKHQWHEENNTYGFSHGLGILIMTIGILTFLGIFSPKIGLIGAGYYNDIGNVVLSGNDSRSMGSRFGKR